MNYPYLRHIKEPKLTFGYDQKIEDPRDGLTLFGPYSRNYHRGIVNVGIIGPEKQRKFVKDYLKKIHKPIKSQDQDLARPYFPGLEAAFNIEINFDAIQEINISEDNISKYLKYTDGHQRVFNLTNLYAKKLSKYHREEHQIVTVWFVAIPDEIYTFGRPKSRIPSSDENIRTRLKKKERSLNFLFPEMNELKEAYEYEVNFHNQIKAKLLNDKIVTQLIRESTIAYEKLWEDQSKIESERLFDTAKAWNISTTLYYKSGGLPWKLGDVRKGVCYLGLVYKRIESSDSKRNACCAAQMFLDSGDGMVFRGNIGPWFNPKSREFHISKSDAETLLSMALESYREKSPTNQYPKEIFIHAKTYFDDDEWQGFLDAAAGKCSVIGIRIRHDNTFKLYRDFSYCIPRGSNFLVNNKMGYLWTNGFVTRIKTQMGLETPNPLSIEVTRGEKDIETVSKDILALSKLNYNACIFGDGSPVTLKFADSIGEVLTAGSNVTGEILPFKHYL